MKSQATAPALPSAESPRPRPVRASKSDGRARIPEIAIERGGEVSPAAFRLYCYYCARRNKESGGWRVPNRTAAEALDLSRSRVSEARKELRAAGWIADLGADFIKPLMGFEGVESPNESVENSTPRIDKDRARGSTSYLPSTLPSDTHTPPARGPASAAAGVCVPQSKFSKETCVEWARSRKAAGAQIDPYAVGRARWMDGTADDEIGAWLAQSDPTAPAAPPPTPSACATCGGAGYYFTDPRDPKTFKLCRHTGGDSPPRPTAERGPRPDPPPPDRRNVIPMPGARRPAPA